MCIDCSYGNNERITSAFDVQTGWEEVYLLGVNHPGGSTMTTYTEFAKQLTEYMTWLGLPSVSEEEFRVEYQVYCREEAMRTWTAEDHLAYLS